LCICIYVLYQHRTPQALTAQFFQSILQYSEDQRIQECQKVISILRASAACPAIDSKTTSDPDPDTTASSSVDQETTNATSDIKNTDAGKTHVSGDVVAEFGQKLIQVHFRTVVRLAHLCPLRDVSDLFSAFLNELESVSAACIYITFV
jgi:hypothetical protein